MPNLVGIWNPDLAEGAVESILSRQLNRVRVPGHAYTDHRAIFPGFGMALQDHGLMENGPQPVVSDDGQTALLLDGEVNNAAELQQQFAAELPRRSLTPPDVCLHLILRRGPDVARLFNGFFCIIVYERTARRVTLISDRYGARALFYVRSQNTLLFATELKALAVADSAPRKIDELGVFELFCYGTHFMQRSWMDGYLHLPPASVLTAGPAQFEIRRYWTYRYAERSRTLDQQTYATRFGILLDRAVERCMRGTQRIGMFLSGGYDSRSVAASLRRHHRPLPAFTFGLPEARDVRFAAMLAERLDLEHHVLSRQGPYLFGNCRAVVWRTEGMITFANATSIQWHSVLKQKMDIILTGFLGEFSGSHTWPELLLARSRRAAIAAIFNRFLAPRLGVAEQIFQPAFYARTLAAARENFDKSFELVEDDHPMNVADSWNVLHLQPRGTFHAPAVDRHRFEMRAPHTDNDLVDFLLKIPPHARLEQRVYKKMIAYSFPDIRDVPCTNSARPIDPNFAREYVRMAGAYVARNAVSALQKPFAGRSKLGREFRDLGQDFRAEPELIGQILRPLLDAGILPESVFRREGIERLVDEHYSGNARHEQTIGLLISLGLAMKYFLHDDLADVPRDMYDA
jgi:asparagine synthetase B (glutamine-hydrolysing)